MTEGEGPAGERPRKHGGGRPGEHGEGRPGEYESGQPAGHDGEQPERHRGGGGDRRREIDPAHDIVIRVGPEELVIRRRYQALSIANDVLIGLWFLIGSFLFFSEELAYAGTWLFVIGSVEMLIRPVIRLARHVHLQKFQPLSEDSSESSFDY